LLSVVLFITKIVAYYVTHSVAILSDALESIVNVLAGFIGLYSLFVAAQPSDEDHPYGHGKAEFISAAIEGGLIVAAGLLILFETTKNFVYHQPITKLNSGIILIALTALVNYLAGIVCIKVGRRNKSLALQASGKHLQIDTYSTLAVIGGLVIMSYTNLYWLDKIIAIALSVFIIRNGYKIIRQSMAGIMDEQDMELLQQMVTNLNENRKVNWIDLHNLRVIKYGNQLHIDSHLTVPWYLNVDEAHKEIDELVDLTRNKFGNSVEFFIHTDGCRPFSCRICHKGDCPVRQHEFEKKVEWTLNNLLKNKKHSLETKPL
jgi:cation diffusion facilitator family transporter